MYEPLTKVRMNIFMTSTHLISRSTLILPDDLPNLGSFCAIIVGWDSVFNLEECEQCRLVCVVWVYLDH